MERSESMQYPKG